MKRSAKWTIGLSMLFCFPYFALVSCNQVFNRATVRWNNEGISINSPGNFHTFENYTKTPESESALRFGRLGFDMVQYENNSPEGNLDDKVDVISHLFSAGELVRERDYQEHQEEFDEADRFLLEKREKYSHLF